MKVVFLAAAVSFAASCGVTAPTSSCPGACAPPLVCDAVRGACVSSMSAMNSGGGSPSTGAGGGVAIAEGLPCEVETLLADSCSSCHGAVLKNGANVRLMTRSDLLAPSRIDPAVTVAQRSSTRMHQMVAAMPPAPEDPVANTALTAFDAWLASGTPVGNGCAMGTGGGSAGTGGGAAGGNAGGGLAGGGGAAGGVSAGGGNANVGGGTSAGGGSASAPYCRSCTAAGQCGAPANFCLGSGATGNCGIDCSAGQACPSGSSCVSVRSGTTVVGKNCFPTSGVCSGTTGGGSAGTGGGTAGTGGGSAGTGGGTSGTGGGAANACASNTDTFANFARSFFATKCASCHHHTGEFTTVGSITSSSRSRISSGNMPQFPTTLTAAEKARVLAWYDCGKRP